MGLRIALQALQFVVTFVIASIVIFVLMRVLPGDAAVVALGINATPELVAQTRAKYGMDRSLLTQYWDWVSGLPTGDFGTSFVTGVPIGPEIADRVQVTLILVGASMLLALLIAVPLGTLAAVRHRHADGIAISGISQIGVAVPGFFAGILLVTVFSVHLGWLPAGGWTAPSVDFGDFLRRLILPVVALGLMQGAILTRYVRSAVMEVMREDFLRTARAKGLTAGRALVRHGLRNASVPVLTVTGVQLAALLIGAVVIERVFVIPGLGSMLVDSVGNRDLLAVQAVVMVLVLMVLVINLLVEVLYSVLDPRLRRKA